MPTTSQMMAEYPDILLQVLAELRGAFLDAAENRREAVELLAAQTSDPTSILMAYQEVVDFHPQAQAAIEKLMGEGGEVIEAQFSREFGGIRQMGPARLEREQPWHAPESVAELLYYYGLIGRGFRGAGQNAHTIIYIPGDVLPWLPRPAGSVDSAALPAIPVPPPPVSRMLLTEDAFLEDMGTLIGFLHTDRFRLGPDGRPNPEDVDRLAERLQSPGLAVTATAFQPRAADWNSENGADTAGQSGENSGAEELAAQEDPLDDASENATDENATEEQTIEDLRLALLLHLAKRLGWLRLIDGQVKLTGNRVYSFLEKNRAEQRFALWDAWRASEEWNDLCRVPTLQCTNLENWANDPLHTREAILELLKQLQPGAWYSQTDLIATIKEAAADFQRPTGDYDSWYIRDSRTKEFLRGFEHWDRVEGSLLRFLFSGPLFWLSMLDLAEPSAGDDLLLSLSQWGARWLELDGEIPNEARRRPISVEEDFTVRVPLGTPLIDRFRVERFAQWQASYPQFSYQLSQRSLSRANEEGIPPKRILDFLQSHSRSIPDRVRSALEKFDPEKQEEAKA